MVSRKPPLFAHSQEICFLKDMRDTRGTKDYICLCVCVCVYIYIYIYIYLIKDTKNGKFYHT